MLGWIALFASYPLALVLPPSTGFENGPIENAQAVLLAAGGVIAAVMAWRTRGTPQTHFWLAMLPFWLICTGRELAWGAAFLPPSGWTEEGPVISSRVLFYRPAIAPVLALLALYILWQFLRHRMDRVVLARLWRGGNLPWAQFVLFAVAMIVSTCAEGHGFVHVPLPDMRAQIMEEASELVGYTALLLMQWRVIAALRR